MDKICLILKYDYDTYGQRSEKGGLMAENLKLRYLYHMKSQVLLSIFYEIIFTNSNDMSVENCVGVAI